MQPSITALIDQAIQTYGHETPRLRCLPQNRYNRKLFPRQGQYDWFSGQVLYCLVRLLRPRQVVEISCANGYSSLFMALALRENAAGILETFELSPQNARAAKKNFLTWGVENCVRLHVGDARKTVSEIALEKTDLLFHARDTLLGRAEPYRVVLCRCCGLAYLNPRPSRAAMGRHYPADYFNDLGGGGASHTGARRALARVAWPSLVRDVANRLSGGRYREFFARRWVSRAVWLAGVLPSLGLAYVGFNRGNLEVIARKELPREGGGR